MSFNPPITDLHSAFDHVSGLIAIIADPAAHRQRLQELIAAEANAKAAIAELHDMEADTRRRNSTSQAREIVVNNREKALDAREAGIEQKADELAKSESTRSDAALRRRESAVESREAAVKAEIDRVAAMRKDYEARLAKIKTFSSTL
jgi:hypothetical protein